MGLYISFSKTEKEEDIFYTARASRDIFRDIAGLASRSFEDAGKLLPITVASLSYIQEDMQKLKSAAKERIALEMIKKDFDVIEMQEDIEYYEDLILELGMMTLLIDIADDNDGRLYLSY